MALSLQSKTAANIAQQTKLTKEQTENTKNQGYEYKVKAEAMKLVLQGIEPTKAALTEALEAGGVGVAKGVLATEDWYEQLKKNFWKK